MDKMKRLVYFEYENEIYAALLYLEKEDFAPKMKGNVPKEAILKLVAIGSAEEAVYAESGEIIIQEYEGRKLIVDTDNYVKLVRENGSIKELFLLKKDDAEANFNALSTPIIAESSYEQSQTYDKFIIGEDLEKLTEKSVEYNPRDVFYKLDNWINSFKRDGKIGVLYGLRGTGKTVIMHQLADKYIKQGVKTAYATFRYKSVEINEIIDCVKFLQKDGYQLVLIDEITNATGMLYNISALSDELHIKIVVAGTDSLLLHWAMQDALFHRFCLAATTSMRYAEYKRIKSESNLDEFITNGGVLWENEPLTVDAYLSTSVVDNIKHSIALLEDGDNPTFRNHFEYMSHDELFRFLVAVCECNTYEAVLRHVEKYWGKNVAWNLSRVHTEVGGKKSSSEYIAVMDGLQKYYTHVPTGGFRQETAEVLIRRLKELNFLAEVREKHEASASWHNTLVITQPYIKQDFIRRTLSVINQLEIGGMKDTTEQLKRTAAGIILEDIIYFEAIARYIRKHDDYEECVFKYRTDNNKEIDVVVFSEKKLYLIEVKHSEQKVKSTDTQRGQDKFLIDDGFIGDLVRFFNPDKVNKTVMYQGKTDNFPDENGVRWVNAEEWLLGQVEI